MKMLDPVGIQAVQRARAAFDVLDPPRSRQRASEGHLLSALEALTASPHGPPRYDKETAAWLDRQREEANVDADPRSLVVSIPTLARMAYVQRDLTVSDPAHGGYLAGSIETEVADAIRPWSPLAQAGLTIVPNVRFNQELATPLTGVSINFSDAGGSASTPTLAAAMGTPKIGYGVTNVSRKLRRQTNAEAYAANDMLRVAARAMDEAVLGGTGVDGQCTGIPNWAGIKTATGAAITHAVITDAKRDATLGGAPSGAWVSTPTVRALLEQREVIADTGQFVWGNDRMASWPAFATPDCPASTLIGGYWPACFVLLYGAGVVIDVNAFDPTLFRQGIVQLRVAVQLDVLLPIPSAFVVATSVS